MPRRFVVPTYQLHRASGQARVCINGVDHYLGPHGLPESKQQYEHLIRKLLTDRERKELAERAHLSASITINMLVAAYLKHARAFYVKDGLPTSEYSNICRALKCLRDCYGSELVT